MEPETAVLAALSTTIAVAVPWWTFRLALRQDQARWLRERRAEVYVDILTEAHAEHEYFQHDILDREAREFAAPNYVDLRLPPFERARLGARGTIFASRTVNALFNRLQGEAMRATMPRPKHEGEQAVARAQVGRAFDELQAAIRAELGADAIDLEGRPAPPSHSSLARDAKPPPG